MSFPSFFKDIVLDIFFNCYIFVIVLFLAKEVASELRFCYHGPHKLQESECPGGFIAFQPLNISCIFYAKGPDIPDLNVSLSKNMCDNDEENEIKLDPNGHSDMSDVTTIHRISFDPVDETADPTDGIEINATVCVHSCFPEFIDPFDPEDFPMLDDKPNQTEEQLQAAHQKYMKTTKELFINLVVQDEDFFDDDEDIEIDKKDDSDTEFVAMPDIIGNKIDMVKGKFTYILKLFAQSLRVTMLKCAPYIEMKYMFQVLRVMTFFYDANEDYDTVDITPFTFRRIFKHLKECENSTFLAVKLNGTQCANQHTIESIFFTDDEGKERVWSYRRLHRSFRWGIYDPVIESAWAAVDFVHGLCFQPFYASGDILYFHLYMTAMEALFPPVPVQAHWMNPVKVNPDLLDTIMDSHSVDLQTQNLDACVIAAYMTNLSPYMERLLRPFMKEAQLTNPQYINITPEGEGWRKSSDEYWRWYESVGGFKGISKNFGYCLDGSRENLQEVEAQLAEKGLSCKEGEEEEEN